MPSRRLDGGRRRCAAACTTCKRRKERCDGTYPCSRCIQRCVADSCRFDGPAPPRVASLTNNTSPVDATLSLSNWPTNESASTQSSPNAMHHTSRLIQDAKGKHMFIGDSANLSFLQTIRQLVRTALGSCAFVDDPLKHLMVEASPNNDRPSGLEARAPPPLSHELATYLLRWYMLATCCVLDLFDEADLLDGLPRWLDRLEHNNSSLDSHIGADADPKYCLVLAIGAQTCPDNHDELAGYLFDHGRYLTLSRFMEDPSIATIQAYALLTMYLLGAARRNAAFMYLGIAVRAAYALGLQHRGVSELFSLEEFRTRERTWRVIRILDLFMSTSLGRPPSTAETRDTQAPENYSASADLCAVFESILNEVYSKRMIGSAALKTISDHHRRWSARFHEGLHVDGIPSEHVLESGMPNIGLIHIKEAYYWTVILLTRPFLIEYVASKYGRGEILSQDQPRNGIEGNSTEVLAYACVDSAIRTAKLLAMLLHRVDIPKRLPFVVNAAFVAALVLGLAYFGDIHTTLPLEESLQLSHDVLVQFRHDKLAERNAVIVEYLQQACNTHRERAQKRSLAHYERIVTGIFGSIREDIGISSPMSAPVGNGSARSDGARRPDPPLENTDLGADAAATETRPVFYDSLNSEGTAVTNSDELDFSIHAISPRTLWFGSFDDQIPLFSLVDIASSGP